MRGDSSLRMSSRPSSTGRLSVALDSFCAECDVNSAACEKGILLGEATIRMTQLWRKMFQLALAPEGRRAAIR